MYKAVRYTQYIQTNNLHELFKSMLYVQNHTTHSHK